MRWVDRTADASEETRVTPTFPSRRLGATVASGLCLVAAAMLLTPAPPATARAPGVACPSSAARHVERGAPACGRSARRSGLRARVRAKGHRAGQGVHRAKGHHAKHEVRRVKRNKIRTTKPPAVTGRVGGAVCEDATAPILAGDGSVSCQDGSEPVCEGGAGATPSSDGSALVCEPAGIEEQPG
jgi:hypothetical protein